MREAEQITLELDRAVPGLKGKGGTPHEPEVGLEKRRIEVIGDAASPQQRLWLQPQALEVRICFSLRPNLGASTRCPLTEETGMG